MLMTIPSGFDPTHDFFLTYREYINEHVVDFAKENPQVAVYVRFRPGRAPRLIGEYCKSNVIATILYTLYMCTCCNN